MDEHLIDALVDEFRDTIKYIENRESRFLEFRDAVINLIKAVIAEEKQK